VVLWKNYMKSWGFEMAKRVIDGFFKKRKWRNVFSFSFSFFNETVVFRFTDGFQVIFILIFLLKIK